MAEGELIERVSKLERQNQKYGQGAVLCLLFLVVIVSMGQGGCEKGQPKRASVPAPVIEQPYQRFLPIAYGQGFLSFPYWAFDTKTGQLCKTWNWQSNSAASHSAQVTGNTANLEGFDAVAAATQPCEQLWQAYPDAGSGLGEVSGAKSGEKNKPPAQEPVGTTSMPDGIYLKNGKRYLVKGGKVYAQ